MKLENWRIISIKKPQLRKIRSSFREILFLSLRKQLKYLDEEAGLYRKKGNKTALNRANKKRNMLLNYYHTSILFCDCILLDQLDYSLLERDMVWNPLSRNWMCSNCYNQYYSTDSEKENLKLKLMERKARWIRIKKTFF